MIPGSSTRAFLASARRVGAVNACVCGARVAVGGAGVRGYSVGGKVFGFIRDTLGFDPPPPEGFPTPENRFHPWDSSPSQDIRTRAAFIKARGKCPVTGKNINFTCPKSGIPTHHDEEAWKMDTDYHKNEVWKILRKVNTYEHDLRSGREFPEFDFPGTQQSEAVVNFLNWDTFLYTRDFYSMDSEFHMAAVTKMLSYPITMASILSLYSPYSLKPKGPLTLEGLKSLAALRYTLFPQDRTRSWQDRPMRFFILGARAESQLPAHAWKQLSFLLPDTKFEIVFIGPEAVFDRQKRLYVTSHKKITKRIDREMSLSFCTDYFHVLNDMQDFMPYDPYLDCFFLFHPGLGAPEAMNQWEKSVPGLLETKCAIFVTGFHKADSQRDWDWLHNKFGDKLDVLLEPSTNIFGSTKWELNDLAPTETYQFNQQLFGFRGKRYHAIRQ
ncbi:Mss51p [Sugiyamaella lignohabitans]|uniref:Mss51p n=1 Tax=Sugiyamaella lignohabitans TaxID=796027 RepID=A0A167CWR8_9ASCO|nr:Mss51p [Sugiyamaella lignohabitans]ANB12199.1 Mss51p [Sugiyamaella lignohabitans]